MSFNTPPDVAPPQKLSIVGAFQAAPTLVKALIACLYLRWLLILGLYLADMLTLRQTVETTVGSSKAPALADVGDSFLGASIVIGVVLLGLVVGAITFLLGKGLARGARSTWLLTLVLAAILLVFGVISVLAGVTVTSMFNVVIMVAILALLLTPVVRQHCTKS